MSGPKPRPIMDRLMEKVDKQQNGCWVFTGSKNKWGYGQIFTKKINGHSKSAGTHRIMFKQKFGKIPKGMCVCHTCDNPACVNPAHLWLGAHQDNRIDCVQKGRAKGASGNTNAYRYTPTQVRKIHQLREKGLSVYKIEKSTGIPKSTVHRIVTGQQYQEVA